MSSRVTRNRSVPEPVYDTDSSSSDEGSIDSDHEVQTREDQRPQPNLELQEKLGSLESVHLINFMCHDNFSIDFGPQVNFVIGRNGSGKSAIMAALMLGFGGRASNTSRGQSVVGFIKKGKDIAKIMIKICNFNGKPEFSYKFEEYGKSILIERTLRRTAAKAVPQTQTAGSKTPKTPTETATSTYSLKNALTGKTISNERKELENIVAYFSIQIDNPVVLLTQEVSKHFLNTNKPKDKYDFFIRATNLKTLKRQIVHVKTEVEKARKTKSEKTAILPEVEAEVKDLEYKVKKLKSVSKWKQDIEVAKTQLIWSEVSSKEKIRDAKKKEMDTEQKKLDELLQAIQEYEVKKDKLKTDIQDLDKEMKDQEKKVTEVNSKIRAVTEKASNVKREKEVKVTEIRQQQSKVTELQKEIKEYDQAIQDVLKKRGDHEKLEVEKQKRQEKKKEYQDRIVQINQEIEDDVKLIIGNKKRIAELRKKVEQLNSEKHSLEKSIDDLKRIIRDMEGSKENSLHIFGPMFPRINEQIEAAFRRKVFREKPVGPLGQFIKLTDPSCSNALQSCLKGLLRAYVCDNLEDTQQLAKLIKDVIGSQGRPPQIITRKFKTEQFDVQPNKINHHKYKSFVDLITVTDPNAFNVLIDKARLETVAYIEDNEEAMEVLLNLRTVPINCHTAYSKDGTLFYPTTNHTTFRKYPSEYIAHANLFSRDFSQDIREHKETIEKHKHSIREIEDEIQELKRSTQSESRDIPAKETQMKKKQQERIQLNARIDELDNFVEPEPVQVTSLEDERDDLKKQLEGEETKLDRLKEGMTDIEKRLKETAEELSLVQHEKQDMTNELKSWEKEKKGKHDQLLQLDASRDLKKKDSLSRAVSQLQEEFQELEEQVTHLTETAKAQSQGERIECDKSADQLKADIRHKEDLVKESEKEVGNFDQINESYNHAKLRLESVKNTISYVDSIITRFEKSFYQRRELYHERRAKVTQIMQETFKRCLNQMGFDGEMVITHLTGQRINGQIVRTNPTLDLKINPRQGHMYRDPRSLSGGERSFSTVAFLLALWEGCNSPFKILDEVDVFMDMITRQVALDSLVQAAMENKKQHIFLSPLPMIDDHLNNDCITIFSMPEPVRVNHEAASQHNQDVVMQAEWSDSD